MSQNNAKDELYTVAVIFAVIGAALYALVALAFLVLMFASLVLTVVCAFAWSSPLTIGRWTLMPAEARGFVYRGLAGAFLLPAFFIFLDILLSLHSRGEYLPHIALSGYALGSLGLDILMAQDESEAPHQTVIPPDQHIAPPPQTYQPPAKPFRFASWDDEDGR